MLYQDGTRKFTKHIFGIVSLIFIFVCTFVGILCFQYYNRLQQSIRDESNGYLIEVTKRLGNNIDRIINDNYAVLESMVTYFDSETVDSFDDVKSVVEKQKAYWNYKDIMVIDETGNAYNSDGKEITLNSSVYLENAVVNRQPSMSMSQMIGNEENVIFAIPVDNLVLDGKAISALASSYNPQVFSQILSMSAFEGQAYSNIISKDGTLIIRSDNSDEMGYNLLSTLDNAKFEGNTTTEFIKSEMENDRIGQTKYTYNGKENYMVYMPINPEDWYLLTFVPVSVVNEKSDLMLKVTIMLCSSITFAFASMMALFWYITYRNRNKLENLAYVDEVTGGNTIQRFYVWAEEALAALGHPQYAMIYTNIEKFKVLNEQFGRDACNRMLKVFHDCVNDDLTDKECMGRLSADNFCILIRYENEEKMVGRFKRWYETAGRYAEELKPAWSLPVTEFGVMVIDDTKVPFTLMIDRAKLALKKASLSVNGRLRYAIYDDTLRKKLIREKQLEDMMEAALEKKEFQVYLQPKYRVTDERIGGAEALSRWVSASEGIIYPDEFIPLFEQNGFIVRLDIYVFEEVCRTIRQWLDDGLSPVKVSINCSRIHLRDKNFLDIYEEISDRYRIPKGLLEIELTESVVMEDSEQLVKVIDKIHEAGYGCSMDDFGSGYSSLNLIQSIPVDTLKLDKIFFRNKDEGRVESVVGGIVTMAKALDMETVAEGVEYKEQVEMLHKLGCDYIQGYVYARPMPITEFERLLFGV